MLTCEVRLINHRRSANFLQGPLSAACGFAANAPRLPSDRSRSLGGAVIYGTHAVRNFDSCIHDQVELKFP